MTDLPKHGLLLSSSENSSLKAFEQQASSFLNKGHTLYAYLLHSGVKHFPEKTLSDLVSKGLHLHVCSLAAEKYGIAFSDEAIFCGLGTLASIIRNTDSFACFDHHSCGIEQVPANKPVLLSAEDPFDHAAGNTLETLRVAAGLAQLSDLTVHLLLNDHALRLFDLKSGNPDLLHESLYYLRLIQEAGAGLHLAHETENFSIPYQSPKTIPQQVVQLHIG